MRTTLKTYTPPQKHLPIGWILIIYKKTLKILKKLEEKEVLRKRMMSKIVNTNFFTYDSIINQWVEVINIKFMFIKMYEQKTKGIG